MNRARSPRRGRREKVIDQDLPPEERAALHRALARGIAQANAGELIDAEVVLAEFGVRLDR